MKNLLYSLIFLLLVSCASIDLPPGGERDTQAPRIVSSSPDSAAVYFTGDQIKITFDEYFALNNFNKSLIVSPPLSTSPKTIIRGKNLIIQMGEPLKPNTTYQFYFDDGIKDLNEGNATKNLRLVFSTGPEIDTSFLSGEVVNAFSRLPEEGIKVMLYKEFGDSQLIKEPPFYITKTDKNGNYIFNNIATGIYHIYALNDENNNNALDILEQYAFLNNSVSSNNLETKLYLSNKNNQPLKINSKEEISKGQYVLTFNKPIETKNILVSTTETFADISKNKTLPWHFGQTTDSIYLYNTSRELKENDSFVLSLTIDNKMFLENLFLKNESETKHTFFNKSNHVPKSPVVINTNYAVKKINELAFEVFDRTDSSTVLIDSIIIKDVSQLQVYSDWKEEHTYQITNNEQSVIYYDGLQQKKDTIISTTYTSKKTGELEIQIIIDSSLNQNNHYFFCLTQNKKIISKKKIQNNQDVVFFYLIPGEYEAYIFQDTDKNAYWTDSDYYQKTQSESIWHLNSPIDIRAKWKTTGILFKIK